MKERRAKAFPLLKSTHVDHPSRPDLDWMEDEMSCLLLSRQTFRNVFRVMGVACHFVDPTNVHPRHCALHDLC